MKRQLASGPPCGGSERPSRLATQIRIVCDNNVSDELMGYAKIIGVLILSVLYLLWTQIEGMRIGLNHGDEKKPFAKALEPMLRRYNAMLRLIKGLLFLALALACGAIGLAAVAVGLYGAWLGIVMFLTLAPVSILAGLVLFLVSLLLGCWIVLACVAGALVSWDKIPSFAEPRTPPHN